MRARGAFFTVLSAILSGVTPAFAKLIYADGVNTVTLVFFRNFFAILPLLLICGRSVRSACRRARACSCC